MKNQRKNLGGRRFIVRIQIVNPKGSCLSSAVPERTKSVKNEPRLRYCFD
jgi:hypothetical protein